MTELADARNSGVDLTPDRRGLPINRSAARRAGVRSADAASSRRLAVIATGVALAVGCVVRFIAAIQLSPHVDEPSSLLAAQVVAERGIPVLPSGTVYFQGATLSYLLQPFMWLGVGGLEHLQLMRMVLVLAGVVTIYLCYRLGHVVTGDARVGAVMAALVALDPLSVQWSGHLRMYGLLQALTVGLAWAYLLLLTRGPSARLIALVIALVWAAVFTHVGAALLVPSMALAAFIVHRRSLFKRWALMGTLAICGLAPVVLITLNETLGTASATATSGEPARSVLTFVGDNLLAPLARLKVAPGDWDWAALTRSGNLFWLVPGLIVGISTIIGGRMLLRKAREERSTLMWHGAVTLLVFYWLPVIVVGLFTVSPKERYLLNVHLLGYLFVAALVIHLFTRARVRRDITSRALAYGVTGLVLLALGAGLGWRLDHTVVHPNHNAAMAYVAERHEPGQPVIVALPPVAWLSLGEADRDDLAFLAGPQDQSRAQRYTRWSSDGELIDYWVGANAIVSRGELESLLSEHPEAWVVVDDERMGAEWAYDGPIEDLLRDTTVQVFEEPGGAMVLRPADGAD